jgi:hypothetical protein
VALGGTKAVMFAGEFSGALPERGIFQDAGVISKGAMFLQVFMLISI